jgi:hypothetical protein
MRVWKNEVEPDRPQMAIWWRVACWISKATRAQAHQRPAPTPTHTHARTHTAIKDISFPLQQWFRERASMLGYTPIACVVPSGKTNMSMKISTEH